MKMPWVIGGIVALVVTFIYFPFLHFSGVTEVGIMRNWITGELKRDTPGWNISPPWVSAAKVDTRPMRVCVTTASRGFNCKLVEFVPSEYRALVATEGFHYYWWYNRLSLNLGYDEEYRGTRDLLRGHAYSVKQYPFVRVLRDFEMGE